MIKKLAIITMLLFVVGWAGSCSKTQEPGPVEILESYLQAHLKGNHEKAYFFISSDDKQIKTLSAYREESTYEGFEFAEITASKMSYVIKNIEQSNVSATAIVEITFPDIESIIGEMAAIAFLSLLGQDDKEIETILLDKLERDDVPTTTTDEVFRLRKEDEGWKVFLDWEAEMVERERREKIRELLSEAKSLEKEHKHYGVVEKYEQALKLDSEMVDAVRGLQKAKMEIELFEEKQAYLQKIELYDLKGDYYKTYRDDRVPGVNFKIRNNGNRTLNRVQVTVYFKDAKGMVIAEERYNPVLVSSYSFGADNNPLKPNYIWQMERGKFYRADSVPSEWKVGVISAKITDIEFE